MLEQLLKLVEENSQQDIIANKAIPDQFNQAAIKEVSTQIISNLKGQVAQGNMQQIISLFQSGGGRNLTSNPLVSTMVTSITASLASRFGISAQAAQSVANTLVPSVMNQIIKKANDPRDIDFDLQQMMRSMTGNNSLDITGMMMEAPKGAMGNIGNIFGKLFGK
ncbi:MAG: hypothetical protein HOP08_16465 [Cyclobacteriaceae bacterium]|nr:hypothetical protein [Cyclobacteriaceae bacterium]